MSFNFIYNPVTSEKYSIFSYEGKSLLKQYIKDYQIGGSGSDNHKTVNEWLLAEENDINKRKIKEYENKLQERDEQIDKVRLGAKIFKNKIQEEYTKKVEELAVKNQECQKKIAEKDKELVGKNQELAQKNQECEEKITKKDQECEEKIAEKDKNIKKLESTLTTIEIAQTKSVEEKENDEDGETTPTNKYKFTIEQKEEGKEDDGKNETFMTYKTRNKNEVYTNFYKIDDTRIKKDNVTQLKSGGSKIVYKIEHGTTKFALAKIPNEKIGIGPNGIENKQIYKEFKNEIECLTNLKHPNIVKLYSYYEDKYYHYLLMEYGESDLTKKKGLALKNVELARKFITNMASAILYLKKMNINHRDIKLANFIIVGKEPNQVVKLIDFGISTRCPGTSGYSIEDNPMEVGHDGPQKMFEMGGGTKFYVAPENIDVSINTHPNDVFALGLCILELFYDGNTIFLDGFTQTMLNIRPVKDRIMKNFPDIDNLEDFYEKINNSVFNGKPIIQGMLEYEPTERIEIEKVLEALDAPVEVEEGAGKED